MPDKHPPSSSVSQQDFIDRLQHHPELQAEFAAILDIVENAEGDVLKADEAEERVAGELQRLGQQALQSWASRKHQKLQAESDSQGKNRLYWYTRYGKVEIKEQTYRLGRRGRQLRPFVLAASVNCRSYSGPLQRAITDFGADHSFAEAAKKLKEHYRIDVPISASRAITQRHAQAMYLQQDLSAKMTKAGVKQLIAEMDGTNVPVVIIPEKSKKTSKSDRRKLRHVGWREARLCLARRPESITAIYRATMGGVDKAGEELMNCVVEAGGGTKTSLHCVGDAARWIINQVEQRFCSQASYLIDFFHMSEYLAGAAEEIGGEQKRGWLNRQQEKMKDNRVKEVVKLLRTEIGEGKDVRSDSSVEACERYLSNHLEYFDYKRALEQGLPIGSGEIEGGHRWIIQKRLKLSGAWWKEDNAAKMLALRVVRANGEWQSYWDDVRQAAA